MVASADRYTSTGALPLTVPWLHTVTETESCCPDVALAGPETADTMKSGLLPTPMRLPVWVLLFSISSEMKLCGSTTAPRYQAPSVEAYAGPCTVSAWHWPALRYGEAA